MVRGDRVKCVICGEEGFVSGGRDDEIGTMWTIDMACIGVEVEQYFCGEHIEELGQDGVVGKVVEYNMEVLSKRGGE